MPTVSGVWKWNDVISVIPGKTLNINFTSNSKSFIQMIVERDVAGNVLFYVEDVTITYVDAYNLYDNTWTNEVYKTIDFGSSGQEVSQDIYTWLTQNATKQDDPVVPTTTKTVSSDNLARFKQKCDETYAGKDEIPNVPAIPTPTTADNGKVLGVANGAYSLLNLFPVGAYYITESTTTPASLFGGEWVQVSGKFLLGQSVQDGYLVGSEGGEKTHTLTTEEMPEHYHQLGSKPNTGNIAVAGPYSADGGGYNSNFEGYIDSTSVGGNQPHNNMPPYRTVNIWRRTA